MKIVVLGMGTIGAAYGQAFDPLEAAVSGSHRAPTRASALPALAYFLGEGAGVEPAWQTV